MDYIRNSKNRKLKAQILGFFSRLTFGSYRLGLSGKGILFSNFLVLIVLFFPWMRLVYMDGSIHNFGAFSSFSWYIGYGIVLGIILIAFFLLSHSKKEQLRAYVPFRLSDTQAIVFIDAMILTSLLHFLSMASIFPNFANQINVLLAFDIVLTLCILILIFSYFFSKSEKQALAWMSYLDKKEPSVFDEYKDILDSTWERSVQNDPHKNMSLPI